jgi:hypothetical protein
MLKSGFAGQLVEATNVAVTAAPSYVNESETEQLGDTAGQDDGTVSALNGSEIQWVPPVYPIAVLTPAGTITAAVVYADTAGAVTGAYVGVTGSVALVVLDSSPDNYGIYAGG